MELSLEPGKYVIAVSGGVDSVVLLDILSHKPGVELIVAHFNHGIRSDADEDERLVVHLARKYKLSVEIGRTQLGPDASEALARQARYNFLREVQSNNEADAIITAHHQDDLIETALINILRGTGPRGLAAPLLSSEVIRPLSNISKKEIYNYARQHKLVWREDITNEDEKYLRNYLRKQVTPKLSRSDKDLITANIDKIAENTKKQDEIIATLSHKFINDKTIDRSQFSALPVEVASGVLTYWLRSQGFRDFDRQLINRINELIRTAKAGSQHDLNKSFGLCITKTEAKLTTRD